MSEKEIPEDLQRTAKEVADMLAEIIANLQALSVGLSGGFERAKQEVKALVDRGMPFPEAINKICQDIVNGRLK